MAEQDGNIISHLLDVERGASELIDEAEKEASKRIASARAQADGEYRKQFEVLVTELEAESAKKTAALSASHDADLQQYKDSLEKTERNTAAFTKLLDSLLFPA